jgi:AcrR family transcriptional regulator
VGIDRILAESGVAKMTLYKYFPSKDELIQAVLKRRDRDFQDALTAFVDACKTPEAKLQAVFVWHHDWFKSDTFNGCMFINAAAEFPNDHPARSVICQHKRRLQAYVEALLQAWLAVESAHQLAAEFSLLLDGAIVSAQMTGNPDAALLAWCSAMKRLQAEGVEMSPIP